MPVDPPSGTMPTRAASGPASAEGSARKRERPGAEEPSAKRSRKARRDRTGSAMEEEDEEGTAGGTKPGWVRAGRPFFVLSEPERVRHWQDLGISVAEVREQLGDTIRRRAYARRHPLATWEVRNRAGGLTANPPAMGVHEPGGVGFLVTVPVPYPAGYTSEYRSPAELVQMYVRAAGPRWPSRLRMVIAVNRFNDPARSQAGWQSELGYGTTAKVEAELDKLVAYWQWQADAVAPGMATVIGQVVEPPVWDDAGGWWIRMCCGT